MEFFIDDVVTIISWFLLKRYGYVYIMVDIFTCISWFLSISCLAMSVQSPFTVESMSASDSQFRFGEWA